jgi:tetratricopeptide (TPR) repeat protein
MRFASAIAAVTLLAAGAVHAQETPAACQPDGKRQVDFQACADAAPKGSPIRALALINLGSEAVMAQNFTAAVRFYDEAVPPGQKLSADASFHAFRARAYDAVGRKEAAVEEARTALDALDRPVVAGRRPDPDIVLSYILPIFYRAEAPEFFVSLGRYLGLPARDWITYANRAAVLIDVDRYDEALAANAEALKSEPGHPVMLNNLCVALTRMGKASEALSNCQKAVELAPEQAAPRDSYADALAALGRCDAAKAELAVARRLDPDATVYQRELACKAR